MKRSTNKGGALPLFGLADAPPAAPLPTLPVAPSATPAAPASELEHPNGDVAAELRHMAASVEAAPLPPAPRARTEEPEPSLAVREVLGFPMRFIAPLGQATRLATTLVCEVITTPRMKLYGRRVVMTTSQPVYVVARAQGLPIFVGQELFFLALAAEYDRVEPHRMADWLERKLVDPSFRIDGVAIAIGGENVLGEEIAPKGWPVGRVLRELGLRLVEVTTGAELPQSLRGEPQTGDPAASAGQQGVHERDSEPSERGAA